MQQASTSPTDSTGASVGTIVTASGLDSSVCVSAPSSPADGAEGVALSPAAPRNGKPESAFKNDRPASEAEGDMSDMPHSAVSSMHTAAPAQPNPATAQPQCDLAYYTMHRFRINC
jgi:hypothetical protein